MIRKEGRKCVSNRVSEGEGEGEGESEGEGEGEAVSEGI